MPASSPVRWSTNARRHRCRAVVMRLSGGYLRRATGHIIITVRGAADPYRISCIICRYPFRRSGDNNSSVVQNANEPFSVLSQPGERMARKVEVRLVDDLDQTPAAETVLFALDGVSYEIDLSAKH